MMETREVYDGVRRQIIFSTGLAKHFDKFLATISVQILRTTWHIGLYAHIFVP